MDKELDELRQQVYELRAEKEEFIGQTAKWKKLFILFVLISVLMGMIAGCFAENASTSRREVYTLRTEMNQSARKETQQGKAEYLTVTKKTAIYHLEKGEFKRIGYLPTYAVIQTGTTFSANGYEKIRYLKTDDDGIYIKYEDLQEFQIQRNKSIAEEEELITKS